MPMSGVAQIIDHELSGWYGPMSFEAMTYKVGALCEYELITGSQFGFSLSHEALFRDHADNAARARTIYDASPSDAVQALHDASLGDFAQALETGNYDHLIF